jgi:ferric-dicitrate binding protein FerR (iron transport regulator)
VVATMNRTKLDELGAAMAQVSDARADAPRAVHGARQRLRESLAEKRARRTAPRAARWVVPAAVVGLCAVGGAGVLGAAWWLAEPKPLTAHVESRSLALSGDWISTAAETKQLRFSDGTTLSLHPETRLQLRETSPRGASVVLARGRALANVEHTGKAEWRFTAGPFQVRVTGTEFDLAWDPDTGVFELALHQGEVLLEGPQVEGTRAIRKGDYVKIEVEPRQTAGAEGATRRADTETDPAHLADGTHDDLEDPLQDEAHDGADTAPADLADEPGDDTASAGADARRPAPARWQDLLESGQRSEALRAVDRVGPARAIEQASARELWTLANAARLGGRPELARSALQVLRSKHGQRGQTAFVLGKVAADQLRARSEAITWFETYLTEAPRGPFAEQALGRLVELQAGTPSGRRAAEQYLERHPNGAYAPFARSSLR